MFNSIYSRLASWNTNNPNKMSEGYLLHLQVGLYALFHRLYGMFPCNFLAYLRLEYSVRGENLAIFSHTIKVCYFLCLLEMKRLRKFMFTSCFRNFLSGFAEEINVLEVFGYDIYVHPHFT